MANLNECFNLNYAGRNYDNPTNKKVNYDSDLMNNRNVINNNFMPLHTAFDRIKVSNDKYDNITRSTNKSICGFECQVCHKSVGYHMAIQEQYPHDRSHRRGKDLPHQTDCEKDWGSFCKGRCHQIQ